MTRQARRPTRMPPCDASAPPPPACTLDSNGASSRFLLQDRSRDHTRGRADHVYYCRTYHKAVRKEECNDGGRVLEPSGRVFKNT